MLDDYSKLSCFRRALTKRRGNNRQAVYYPVLYRKHLEREYGAGDPTTIAAMTPEKLATYKKETEAVAMVSSYTEFHTYLFMLMVDDKRYKVLKFHLHNEFVIGNES